MLYDMSGMQRSADKDNPDFYTLNAAGTINAFIENSKENIKWDDGSRSTSAGDDTISGKVLFPNRGGWSSIIGGGFMMGSATPPSLGGIGTLGPLIGYPGGSMMDPNAPSPEAPFAPPSGTVIPWSPQPGPPPPDPHGRLDELDPGFHPHFPRGPFGPGSSITMDAMMSAGYNDPSFGLPSDAGGSFIGVGEMTKCIMPLPIMPATPPGGLFGPDAFVPFWGNPGYDTPANITNPGVFMPLPSGAWDEINSILADPGLGGAVGGSPSIPSLGSIASGPPVITGGPPSWKDRMPEIMPARPRPRPSLPESTQNPFITVETYQETQKRVFGHVLPRRLHRKRRWNPYSLGAPHPTIPGLYYAGGGNWRSGYAGEIGSQIHVGSGGAGKKVYRNVRGIEAGGRGAPRRNGGLLGKILDVLIIAAGVILAGALIYGAVAAISAAAAFVTGVVIPPIVETAAAISSAIAPYFGLAYSYAYLYCPWLVGFITAYVSNSGVGTATDESVKWLIEWAKRQPNEKPGERPKDPKIIPYCPPWPWSRIYQ